jgi:hypothetical protein
MRIMANIDEADIAKVRERLVAEARVDAFPGELFRGEVTEVRYGATTTSGVVTYPAVLTVQNPALKLRPGMTATITVTSSRHTGVLRVPNAALRYEPGAFSEGADAGVRPRPKVMIPLASTSAELAVERAELEPVVQDVLRERGRRIPYAFGTMVETPRAALVAGRLATHAAFFSFGTNDLTQTTFGISRDDAATGFLQEYLQKGILHDDPFATIDRDGVGELMRMAVDRGRAARPDLEVGICGEHGGEPRSIAFCDGIGVDYVSCSPFRVPVARLAAAQAALARQAAAAKPRR